MVKLMIDQKAVEVPEGSTIMEAAENAGIPIPRLCFLKDINEIGACRVCVVEIEGREKLVTSCNNEVEDGMIIPSDDHQGSEHSRGAIQERADAAPVEQGFPADP